MNLVAPVARAIFIRNHAQIMTQGGKVRIDSYTDQP